MIPEDTLRSSPLVRGLNADSIAFLESVAAVAEFGAGQLLFEEDSAAESFYLVGEGRVGLEALVPAGPAVLVETIGPGALVGVSWLFPPFRWSWAARALAPTKALVFPGEAVRRRCDADADLALHVYRTVAEEAVRRLHSTRIRLLDLYGDRRP